MMKAAAFTAVKAPLAVETVPDPFPGAGEAVIRVNRCLACVPGYPIGCTRVRPMTGGFAEHDEGIG